MGRSLEVPSSLLFTPHPPTLSVSHDEIVEPIILIIRSTIKFVHETRLFQVEFDVNEKDVYLPELESVRTTTFYSSSLYHNRYRS